MDSHPGGLPVLHRQPTHRLVLQDRGATRPAGPHPELPARQGPRWLLVDQRHDLHARPGRRLRWLGGRGQPRLALARRAAVVQEKRKPFCRRIRFSRRQRRLAGGTPAPVLADPRCLPERRRAERHRPHRRLQPGRQRRLWLLPGQPESRHPLECRQGVPQADSPAPQPDGADRRRGRSRVVGKRSRLGGQRPLARSGENLQGAQGNHPVRRFRRLTEHPATFRHRSAPAVAAPGHRRRA
ncbi:hypothetical protein D3C76_1145260 [compost metagenome]